MSLPPYLILNKKVGETPLEVLENWRKGTPEASGVPLAYAGRLDPMAEGQLLVLIGEECKVQTNYHNLDKEYQITIGFGLHSDSGDVLGIIEETKRGAVAKNDLDNLLAKLLGEIHFPYPIFSAKTVAGKPLHTWAMEGRLNEITIPTRTSQLYRITLDDFKTITRDELVESACAKIALLPTVTDPRKALGNDFRRPDVLASWDKLKNNGLSDDVFFTANLTVTCSSGTYMRTLSEIIAEKLNTSGLALKIARTKIGHYDVANKEWRKLF